jgi:hypothetical protein
MNKKLLLIAVICVIAVSYNIKTVFGDDNHGSDIASCDIQIHVDSIIEWEAANVFDAINLDTQDDTIAAQADVRAGSSHLTLWTNCNVTLTADNTTASQLTHQSGIEDHEDTLVTKYKISTLDQDAATVADGTTLSGATVPAVGASHSDDWITYDKFLKAPDNAPLEITHVNKDGNVEIKLEVQASNRNDTVSDRGLYTATQQITATWKSDFE